MPESRFIKAFLINQDLNSKEWKLSPDLIKHVSPSVMLQVVENEMTTAFVNLHLSNLARKEFD